MEANNKRARKFDTQHTHTCTQTHARPRTHTRIHAPVVCRMLEEQSEDFEGENFVGNLLVDEVGKGPLK